MLLDLPIELLAHILSFIHPRESLTTLTLVHPKLYYLVTSPFAWRRYVEHPNMWKFYGKGGERIEEEMWKEEFLRRAQIEDNWMNGRFKSYQLLSTHDNGFSVHMNFLAHVQFPKLIKCIHFEDLTLATAANDNLIHLWDIKRAGGDHSPIAVLKGHTSLIQHMQFHDQILVSGSLDGINVWDMKGGACRDVLHENERCYQLQFEDHFLLHGYTFGFKAWDLHTKKLLRDEGGQFSITCLSFKTKKDNGVGPGWLMACATHWGDVTLWDLREFKCLKKMKSSAYQIHISGDILAVAGDGGVEIYDLCTHRLLQALHFDQDVTSIHLKGDVLLVGCTDGYVRVWHLPKMRELTIIAPQLDRFVGFMQTDWEHLVIKSNFNVGVCNFGQIFR